jgi:acyl carrier protein phosphodiesterase
MNYLGHAFLSFGDPEILVGNIAGDHVKGRLALQPYPERIQKGFLLHRKIDAYADVHPANQRAKLVFRSEFGLYSGAIVDTLYDHFLANDPRYFDGEAGLLAFTQNTYTLLDTQTEWLPPAFMQYYTNMKTHNWLYNYRHLKGAERSLKGLAHRAPKMPPVEGAYNAFVAGYYYLNQCYMDFIGDMVAYVQKEMPH